MRTVSFADTSIVACATISLELKHLKDAGELEDDSAIELAKAKCRGA